MCVLTTIYMHTYKYMCSSNGALEGQNLSLHTIQVYLTILDILNILKSFCCSNDKLGPEI